MVLARNILFIIICINKSMKFKSSIVVIAVASLTLMSCKKPVPGCMDENAENYNYLAEEDDGTCSYRGSAVFYHDMETSQNLLDDGVTNVKLYVDDVFFDAMLPNIGFNFVPGCSHPDAMNMENYGIGSLPSKSFGYKIKDQDNFLLSAGTFTISGNQCNAIEYVY